MHLSQRNFPFFSLWLCLSNIYFNIFYLLIFLGFVTCLLIWFWIIRVILSFEQCSCLHISGFQPFLGILLCGWLLLCFLRTVNSCYLELWTLIEAITRLLQLFLLHFGSRINPIWSIHSIWFIHCILALIIYFIFSILILFSFKYKVIIYFIFFQLAFTKTLFKPWITISEWNVFIILVLICIKFFAGIILIFFSIVRWLWLLFIEESWRFYLIFTLFLW